MRHQHFSAKSILRCGGRTGGDEMGERERGVAPPDKGKNTKTCTFQGVCRGKRNSREEVGVGQPRKRCERASDGERGEPQVLDAG